MEIKPSQFESLICKVVADTQGEDRVQAVKQVIREVGEDKVFDFACSNQVEAVFSHVVQEVFGSDNTGDRWLQAHQENQRRIAFYLSELDRIAGLMSAQGIPIAVLKNGGIARGIYPCPGCCPMGDLDVLVEKRFFRQAHKILLDEGYCFEFRSPLEKAELEAAERSGGAEYSRILPDGEKLWFELQWRPVAGRWIRPDQEQSAGELMSRSIPVPGTAVRLLSPEDNLLQTALHTAKHSYVRAPGFRLHTDVDRIVRRQKINWSMFLARVQSLQVKTAVYFSLAIPRALFDTPVPEEVLESLRPPAWKERLVCGWLQRAGFFHPEERKFSRLGFIVFAALLYDDWSGLGRGIFPKREWMRQRYSLKSDLQLPIYYSRRLMNLLLRRTL